MDSFFPPHPRRRWHESLWGLPASLLSLQPLLYSPDISLVLQTEVAQTLMSPTSGSSMFSVQSTQSPKPRVHSWVFQFCFVFPILSVTKYIKKYPVGKIEISPIPIFMAFFLITVSILCIFLVLFFPLSNFNSGDFRRTSIVFSSSPFST